MYVKFVDKFVLAFVGIETNVPWHFRAMFLSFFFFCFYVVAFFSEKRLFNIRTSLYSMQAALIVAHLRVCVPCSITVRLLEPWIVKGPSLFTIHARTGPLARKLTNQNVN